MTFSFDRSGNLGFRPSAGGAAHETEVVEVGESVAFKLLLAFNGGELQLIFWDFQSCGRALTNWSGMFGNRCPCLLNFRLDFVQHFLNSNGLKPGLFHLPHAKLVKPPTYHISH